MALIGVAVAASIAAGYSVGYSLGYRAGAADQGPQHRALVVTRASSNGSSGGSSATWFDIRNPQEAARLANEERRLQAIGADYYVAKGVIEKTLRPEPDPRRVNSHR
jgi:hypothetical protein